MGKGEGQQGADGTDGLTQVTLSSSALPFLISFSLLNRFARGDSRLRDGDHERLCVCVCFFSFLSPLLLPPSVLFPPSVARPFLSRDHRDFTVPRSRQLTLSPLNCATNEAAALRERERERVARCCLIAQYLPRCETRSVALGVTGATHRAHRDVVLRGRMGADRDRKFALLHVIVGASTILTM